MSITVPFTLTPAKTLELTVCTLGQPTPLGAPKVHLSVPVSHSSRVLPHRHLAHSGPTKHALPRKNILTTAPGGKGLNPHLTDEAMEALEKFPSVSTGGGGKTSKVRDEEGNPGYGVGLLATVHPRPPFGSCWA